MKAKIATFVCILSYLKPFEDETLRIKTSTTNQPWEEYGGLRKDYLDNPIPEDKLVILSLWQLRLLRNTYYARHGKIFNLTELDNYFRNQGGRYWYNPKADFKENDLTPIEKENINIISQYESNLKKLIHK